MLIISKIWTEVSRMSETYTKTDEVNFDSNVREVGPWFLDTQKYTLFGRVFVNDFGKEDLESVDPEKLARIQFYKVTNSPYSDSSSWGNRNRGMVSTYEYVPAILCKDKYMDRLD